MSNKKDRIFHQPFSSNDIVINNGVYLTKDELGLFKTYRVNDTIIIGMSGNKGWLIFSNKGLIEKWQ